VVVPNKVGVVDTLVVVLDKDIVLEELDSQQYQSDILFHTNALVDAITISDPEKCGGT